MRAFGGRNRHVIPVILITGYLGSGKTTVLNELLKQDQRKVAIVVNDMGEVNVDAKTLNKAQKLDTTMIELSNGCICCTLRDEFMTEIEKLSRSKGLEAIFVEASGISDPASIAQAFLASEMNGTCKSVRLSSIVTVVDADRIWAEFMAQMNEKTRAQEEEDPDVINLVMDQIEFCNLILLNKCDLLDEEKLEEVKKVIRKLQPEAPILQCVRGKVNADVIINDVRFDYDHAMNSSMIQKVLKRDEMGETCDDEYGITSFVFEERKPFDRERFFLFLENEFPETIIRSKGYVWFADDPIHVQLVETAGRNASVTEFSNWVDAFDEKDKQDVFENYPEVLEEWDEEYGDRLNQLVFIGKDYEKQRIKEALAKCLA